MPFLRWLTLKACEDDCLRCGRAATYGHAHHTCVTNGRPTIMRR